MRKGKFITIYGINNVGKSTHTARLVKHLQANGLSAITLKYPIYDLRPTGPQLNQILRGKTDQQGLSEEALQTLFRQNRADFEPELLRTLEQGTIVVAEDYTGTGIAWGTAKGLPRQWLEELNNGLIKEDLAILLVGKRFLQAQEKNHLHEENHELVEKVQEVLIQLARHYGWHIVEQQPKIEETEALLWGVVEQFLRSDQA